MENQKLDFNQENVNKKIAEIKKMKESDRAKISIEVKVDLRAWLLRNFKFTEAYQKKMAHWPQSLREETGFGIGTALLHDDWKLEIIFPPNPEPSEKPTKHEQTVKGDLDPITGKYTITKSHTWTW